MSEYVLVYNDGDYVAVDQPSGGYPFRTNTLNTITFWTNVEEAIAYMKHFPEITELFEVELKRTLCLVHKGKRTTK